MESDYRLHFFVVNKMNENIIRDTIIKLRQNNIDNNIDSNLRTIINDLNSIILKLNETENIQQNLLQNLINILKDLVDAYKIMDIVYIADVLEYELLGILPIM